MHDKATHCDHVCVKHVIYMCIYVHIIKTGRYMTGMVSSDETLNFLVFIYFPVIMQILQC